MKNMHNARRYKTLILILILPQIFIFFTHFLTGMKFHHDTLYLFSSYKYLYVYFASNFELPQYIDYLAGGIDSSIIIGYDFSKIFYPIFFLFNYLNFSAFSSFLFNIGLIYSIFFLGLFKIKNYFNLNNKSFFIILFISFFSLYIGKTQVVNLTLLLPFPFIFLYINKFIQNHKFHELVKISRIFFFYFLNSFMYFSVFFFYTVLIFILITLALNKIRILNIKIKIYHLLEIIFYSFLIFIILIYFKNYIEQNFFFPERIKENLGQNLSVSFDSFLFQGYQNTLQKFLTFLSNFYWMDVPLVISSTGIIGLALFFIYPSNNKLFISKLSITFFIVLILFLSEPLLSKKIAYILYNLPFMDKTRHLSYMHIFIKPLLLILVLLSIDQYIRSDNDDKHNKFIYKFLILYLICFIAIYLTLFFLSNISGNNFVKSFISQNFNNDFIKKLFSKNLFRNLEFEFFISFLISYSSILFLFIIKKFYKINNYILFLVPVLFSYIPNLFFYSFDERINIRHYKSEQLSNLNKEYKLIIESKTKLNDINNIKYCKDNTVFSSKIQELIPKLSIPYQNIYLLTKNKNCDFDIRYDFYNIERKNYYLKNKFLTQKKYFHFNKDTRYTKINNEEFIIHKINSNKNLIETNLSFSKNWYSDNNNYQILKDQDGTLLIKINGKFEEFKIFYKNYKNKLISKFSIFSGFLIFFYFLFSLNREIKLLFVRN